MTNQDPARGFAFPVPEPRRSKRGAGFAAFCVALAAIAAFVYADVAEASQTPYPERHGSPYGSMGSFEGY